MKKNKKVHIYYLFLGIGIGLVLGSIINIVNPKVEYKEYTEAEIRQKAMGLGMYDLDKIFEMNAQLNEQIEKNLEKKAMNQQKDNSETKDSNEFHEEDEKNMEKDNDEASVENNSNEAEEKEYIEFKVKEGDSSQTIVDNLYKANIIDDKEQFVKAIIRRKAARRLHYGIFKFSKDDNSFDYDTVIDVLTQ